MTIRLRLFVALMAATCVVCAQPPAPPNLDHFNCYFTDNPQFLATAVLQDQFDGPGQVENVKDLRLFRFCNPVQKTLRNGRTTPILHSADHLAMYLMNPQPTTPRRVQILNQFGGQTLYTYQAMILAVPSGKALPTSSGAPPSSLPSIPRDLDHFKCYVAEGNNIKTVVSLTDQFQTDFARVLQPIYFCNPVQKTVTTSSAAGGVTTTTTPITNPTAHLACYATAQKPFQAPLFYNNQFVTPNVIPQLVVYGADFLCVPTLKLNWSVILFPTLFGDGNGGDQDDGNGQGH